MPLRVGQLEHENEDLSRHLDDANRGLHLTWSTANLFGASSVGFTNSFAPVEYRMVALCSLMLRSDVSMLWFWSCLATLKFTC